MPHEKRPISRSIAERPCPHCAGDVYACGNGITTGLVVGAKQFDGANRPKPLKMRVLHEPFAHGLVAAG